jgi:uncharacterized protein UPF0158
VPGGRHQVAVGLAAETVTDHTDRERARREFEWLNGLGSLPDVFIGALADEDRADRLSIAISGRGAFRRFKDVLERWPGELERWHAFSAERQRGRARSWLAAAGYSPRWPARRT